MLRVLARVTLVGVLVATLAVTLAAIPGPGTAAERVPDARATDIADQIRALPGVVEVTERSAPRGFRFYAITFRQPVDHEDPEAGTFLQRLTLLHRSVDRPTVMYTSGYYVYDDAWRSEPAEIVDGNQLSMEHRFFEPSRPSDPDWSTQLTIEQAAADQHAVIQAFQQLYEQPWITTGPSKGGMTATYHRRFYPDDVAGTVAYVAPNDVDNADDRYNAFLSEVVPPDCRRAVSALQRRVLGPDRAWFLRHARNAAKREGQTWRLLGSPDRALEFAAVDAQFAFWQYHGVDACGWVPGRRAGLRQVWYWFQDVNPLTSGFDEQLTTFQPYYYQASHQLGWPESYERPLRKVLRYAGQFTAPAVLPEELRTGGFDATAMSDVDAWVRTSAERMLFVYGEHDPWSAEPFDCGTADPVARECSVHVASRGTHGTLVMDLPRAERTRVTAQLRSWAGLPPEAPPARPVPRLDRPDPATLRPSS